MQTLGPASWDWQERAHKLVWKFKRVQGGTDLTLKVNPSVLHLVYPCASRTLAHKGGFEATVCSTQRR